MSDPDPSGLPGFESSPGATRAAARADDTPGWERATLEKLAFAALNEQKATRRWKTFVRLAWLAFFVLLFWALLYRGAPHSDKSTAHTAVVEIKGEIASGADASAEFVVAAMRSAFEDEGAQAVVVLMDGFGFTGLMDKLGVERRLMTAGANKGFLDPFSPQSPEQRAFAQTMLDQIHKQFIAAVRKGRGQRLKETPEMFSGLFWTGQQSIEMGLADQLGNLDFVAREVVKAEEVIDYTRRDNVAERLAKRFGAAVGEGAVKALRSLPAIR
jgi:ClpP class serine protease